MNLMTLVCAGIVVFLLSLATPACVVVNAVSGDNDPSNTSDIQKTLTVGDLQRTYILHLPKNKNANSSTPLPLVLAFHGGGHDAPGQRRLSHLNTVADSEGFIVVYPAGLKRRWNDGRGKDHNIPNTDTLDDIGFVKAMLKEIQIEYSIDEKRIYATGISNGGMLCYRLALEMSDTFAAIASVAANLTEALHSGNYSPGPISVLVMNGTEDNLMPYEGGDISTGQGRRKKSLGKVLSTEDTVLFWAKKNGCSKKAQRSELADKDPNDGTRVKKTLYSGGKQGTEVVLYSIIGGGHRWPGYDPIVELKLLGRVSKDIKGSEVIWEFFKQHPKK